MTSQLYLTFEHICTKIQIELFSWNCSLHILESKHSSFHKYLLFFQQMHFFQNTSWSKTCVRHLFHTFPKTHFYWTKSASIIYSILPCFLSSETNSTLFLLCVWQTRGKSHWKAVTQQLLQSWQICSTILSTNWWSASEAFNYSQHSEAFNYSQHKLMVGQCEAPAINLARHYYAKQPKVFQVWAVTKRRILIFVKIWLYFLFCICS